MREIWSKHHLKLEVVFIALLAGAVRLTDLGRFLAIDEEDRWAWAVAFYQALLARDLPGTLVGDGYPGIFPVWLETIWLSCASVYRSILQGGWIGQAGVYALTHEWERTANLALQRFPVALVNTVLVVLIFIYVRRLFGSRVALVAGILIALDPFYLSDSRVNRAEALLTGLMTLSLLSLLTGLRRSDCKQVLLSGLFGGLAWLTKSQALVLLPMFGTIGLLWWLHAGSTWRTALSRWLVTLGLWIGAAALTFVLLWPATWTVPADTFGLMADYATHKAGAEGVNLFFLGRTLLDEDPGPFFYPVIFLLRITPLTLLGLLLGAWWAGQYLRQQPARWQHWRRWLDDGGRWVLLAYCLLYVGGMSLGSHKQDRFLMAIFPILGILAGMAFVKAFEARFEIGKTAVWQPMSALALLLGLQLATTLPYHPYYFTYFNPLLGGGPVAARLTRVGWGEGMDQVAAYLNSLDNPAELRVAARFYRYLVGFKGQAGNLGSQAEWLQADKIIFYIQQVQRMADPSPGLIRYFQQHVPPEKIITIDGIDYAWVYPNPIPQPADPNRDRLEGRLALWGYDWQTADGEPFARLIWENLGHPPETLAVRLWQDQANHSAWYPCHPVAGFEAARTRPGEIVESVCPLPDLALTPGFYDLQLGLDETAFDFPAGRSTVQVTASGQAVHVDPQTAFAQLAAAAVPVEAVPLEHTYAEQIRLLAYTLSAQSLQPGQAAGLTLYWQAIAPVKAAAHVSVQAFINGQPVINLNQPPLSGTRPTDTWPPGRVFSDSWTISFPADLPAPALVTLGVGLFDPQTVVPWPVRNLAGTDIPNAITSLRLLPVRWPAGGGDYPLDYTFVDKVRLSGYDLEMVSADSELVLTLHWQSLAPLDQDYIAFVHLLDEAGQLVAQSDVPPQGGAYPSSTWQPGEVILSWHRLIPAEPLPRGNYTLLAGLYRPGDAARLPAFAADGEPVANDAAPIHRFQIP